MIFGAFLILSSKYETSLHIAGFLAGITLALWLKNRPEGFF